MIKRYAANKTENGDPGTPQQSISTLPPRKTTCCICSFTAKGLKQGNLWPLTAYLTLTADYPDFQEGCLQLVPPSAPLAAAAPSRLKQAPKLQPAV